MSSLSSMANQAENQYFYDHDAEAILLQSWRRMTIAKKQAYKIRRRRRFLESMKFPERNITSFMNMESFLEEKREFDNETNIRLGRVILENARREKQKEEEEAKITKELEDLMNQQKRMLQEGRKLLLASFAIFNLGSIAFSYFASSLPPSPYPPNPNPDPIPSPRSDGLLLLLLCIGNDIVGGNLCLGGK